MFSHLRFVIPLAISAARVTFLRLGKPIAVQLDTETRLIWYAYTTVYDGHATTEDHFVPLGLPRVVGVARIGQLWCRGGGMGHSHERDA